MDHASPFGAVGDPPIEVTLYTRPGCSLCDETRARSSCLLGRARRDGRPARASSSVTSRRIPTSQRAFFAEIPVVELGGRRLDLATSPAKLERLLADVLDG